MLDGAQRNNDRAVHVHIDFGTQDIAHFCISWQHINTASALGCLGASLTLQIAAFTPEGGAYGHGRTMGHDHGPAGHFALTHG